MAKLVFGMSQSLDGYVDGVAGDLELPPPGPALFHHFYEWVRDLTGSVYGRRVYELMRYWDEDRPEWSAEQRDFAAVWRRQPKWVGPISKSSEQDNEAGELDESEEVLWMKLPTHKDAALPLDPCEEPLDEPTP